MNFADSLRRHLSDRGLTQSEFAKVVFGDKRALENYFRKNQEPTASRLIQIAQHLGLSMEKTYDYDYKEKYESEDSLFSKQTLELAHLIDKLDDEDFYCVSEMVGVLSRKEKYTKKGDARSSIL